MKTRAGALAGQQGSYCLSTDSESQCVDMLWPHPSAAAVVRPREWIVLRSSEGSLSSPTVAVGALGCDGSGGTVAIHKRSGLWRLRAPRRPGGYALVVSARFRTDAARGDTTAGFGIIVSRTKARAIVPASRHTVC
jgi:hypothetical protein